MATFAEHRCQAKVGQIGDQNILCASSLEVRDDTDLIGHCFADCSGCLGRGCDRQHVIGTASNGVHALGSACPTEPSWGWSSPGLSPAENPQAQGPEVARIGEARPHFRMHLPATCYCYPILVRLSHDDLLIADSGMSDCTLGNAGKAAMKPAPACRCCGSTDQELVSINRGCSKCA